jgi:hypothetical protein
MEPQQRTLVDDEGREVLRVLETPGLSLADVEEVLAEVGDVVPAVMRELAGWNVASNDDALIDALVAAGARQVRVADVYSRDLRADPPDPTWAEPTWFPLHGRMRLVGHSPQTLAGEGQLAVRAYPSDHVDTETDDPAVAAQLLERLYDGEYIGPVLDPSAVVVDDDRVVAVLVVNRMPGEPPSGGPWVSEIFRDPHPTYAGLGAALLRRALALLAVAGESTLGLAVTRGNPARRVYELVGLQHVSSSRKVLVP